jgi:hypothetical protein
MNFLAVDRDMRRGSDPQANLVAAQTDYRDDDVARDAQRLVGTAAEDEHVGFTPVLREHGLKSIAGQGVAGFDDANRRRRPPGGCVMTMCSQVVVADS